MKHIATSIKTFIQTVISSWKELSKNRILHLTYVASKLSVLIGILIILITWQQLPPQVPLWYSKPWGADRLVHPVFLFLLPLGGLCITFLNTIISSIFLVEHLVFAQILMIFSLVTNCMSIIILFEIIGLVL